MASLAAVETSSQYGEAHTWLYEADEDDYDFDEADLTWQGGFSGMDTAGGAGEGEEVQPVIVEANVPSDAFYDDLGLLKCWGAALLDYKVRLLGHFSMPSCIDL